MAGIKLAAFVLSTACSPDLRREPKAAILDYKCPDCNVILISIDTLRADHLGCYGYSRETSPNLDRFAEQNVLFEQCVNTGGRTLPVHMSMMTSLYPAVHAITMGKRPQEHNQRLPDARITLAEQLQEAGYLTAGFLDNGWMQGKFGFDQGFDDFDDEGGHFEEILPKVYRWLYQNHQRRFFLFIHTYDVHSGLSRLPYDSPEGYSDLFFPNYSGDFTGCLRDKCGSPLLLQVCDEIREGKSYDAFFSDEDVQYLVALYDGGIAYVDAKLGLLFDHLRKLGIYDKSLIIVTADHGEEFLEHNNFLHVRNYEEVAHVPLIVKFPRSAIVGARIPDLTATVDIMPTILDVVDVPINVQAQGLSLMSLLFGEKITREYVHIYGLPWAKDKLRSEKLSLLIGKDRKRLELYDLERDPGELTSIGARMPGVRERLLSRFIDLVDSEIEARKLFEKNHDFSETTIKLSEEEIERLKALGYLK